MKINPERDNQYYRNLTRKMVLPMISISVIPLVLVAGIALYYYSVSLKENVIAYQKALVITHKIHVDNYLYEKLADIQVLADLTPLETLLNDRVLHDRLSVLKRRYGAFVDLGIIDRQGYQRAYDGPFKLEHARYSEADWFKKAMSMEYYISDVFTGLRGLPHFIIAIRVKDSRGRLWIIRSTIDIEKFTSMVEDIEIGKTGYAFILNRNGEFQTKLSTKTKDDIPEISEFLNRELSKEKISIFEYTSKTGKQVIYAVTPLKKGDWLLICQQDSSDAFAQLYYVRNWMIFISFLGFVSVLLISLIITRKLVGKIQRSDQARSRLGEQVIEAGKFAAIGELAAGIAHEVNNPVAIMVEEAGWMGDLLEDEASAEGENRDEFKRALGQIKIQGERCKQITQKLLSFARKSDVKTSKIQLNEIIEEMVNLSSRTARYSNVVIETMFQQVLPEIMASSSEIQQVLLNMINNAIDAIGKEGGKITISTRIENEFIVIDIADTGSGIPEGNIEKIFDPFFTTKPVGKGTGIGLSVCYGIIYHMGGKISIDTEVGKGTTFHIFIPIEN